MLHVESLRRDRPGAAAKRALHTRLRASLVCALAAIAGCEAFDASPLPGAQPARTAALSGPVTHVRDGDTIVVAGTPLRFASLDCAERGTAAGERATRAMRRLAAGRRVDCSLTGRRSYDRVIGECALPDGTDLSRAMLAGGYCRAWR